MITFRHVTVLPCTGEEPAEDATVVVEGDVIKDVLTGGRAAHVAAGEVLDCPGHAPAAITSAVQDLLGPLARHKTRELAIKASVLGAHDTLIATTRTSAELLGIADRVAGQPSVLIMTRQGLPGHRSGISSSGSNPTPA
jgi:hypothetical protein